MAGIACARYLLDGGFRPIVFEKSRGLGGRLATRRTDHGLAFDHGAQYVTARSPQFRTFVGDAIARGAADYWRPVQRNGADVQSDEWIIGVPGMNSLVKPLAEGIDVRLACQVANIRRHGYRWWVETVDGAVEPIFDILVCTAPAPQAQQLLSAEPAIADALGAVSMAPCWALMLSFAMAVEAPFDVRRSTSDDLAWVVRDASKPHRSSRETWVIHASPDWSRRHLELSAADAVQRMVELLPDAVGMPLPQIDHASAHRWRYALTTSPLGRAYLCSDDRTLFVGGDWALGGRVEYAFESGRAMAEAVAEAALHLPR